MTNISADGEVAGRPARSVRGNARTGRTRSSRAAVQAFLISDDGYIVTNNHVVTGGPRAASR